MSTKLIQHKSILESNGYNPPPHYVGLTNHAWLFCNNCKEYSEHTLFVRSASDFRYVCEECNCCVEYVD